MRDCPYGICCPWLRGGWTLDTLGPFVCHPGRPARSYRLTGRQEVIGFGGRPHEVIGFGDLWGPSGTIWDLWGPSGDHHSKKLSIFSHFSSKYVFFSQKHTFQILDANFPKRFRLKPHINQNNLNKMSNIHVSKNSFPYSFPQKKFPILIPISFPIFINIPNKIY